MRIAALTVLTATIAFTSAPARAQAYDPGYPVCIRTGGLGGSSIDCSFTSLPQCNATASGRSAQCFDNPYYGYGGARTPAGPSARRPRG